MTSGKLVRELFFEPLLAQRRRLYGIALSLLVLAASQALFLLMVKGFIKALFQSQGVVDFALADLLPQNTAKWIPQLSSIRLSSSGLTIIVPAAILFAGWAKSLASYLYQLNQQGVALYLAKNYRERLFRALVHLPYVKIGERPVGVWMSLIMNDVMLLQNRFTDIMTSLVRDSVAIVACFAALTVVHWPSALCLLLLSPFIALGMGRTGKRIAKFAEIYQRELGRIAAAVLDLRSRFNFIRSQHGEDLEMRGFAAINRAYYRMIRRSIMVRSAFAPVLEFIGFAVFALAVYAIGHGYLGDFSPAMMLQFFVALGLLLRPLREIGEQLARFHETRGALVASLSVFEAIKHEAVAAHQLVGRMEVAPALVASGIVIEAIQAGMDGTPRFTASGLALRPGRAVAVIGPSGAGKSTLIKTLAGLVRPIAWTGSCSWQEFAGLVTMVSQDPFLFDDTLQANLEYGLDAAHIPTEDEIWSVLEKVNIAAEIKAWPLGLATRLRAIGSNISGGQLQRLVIARALLRQRPVWLLDEATAAVDARSERDITQRLINACHQEQRYLLAVTHRLTWLAQFDEVWFIENGRLELVGSHQELLSHPRYRAFCASSGGAE